MVSDLKASELATFNAIYNPVTTTVVPTTPAAPPLEFVPVHPWRRRTIRLKEHTVPDAVLPIARVVGCGRTFPRNPVEKRICHVHNEAGAAHSAI
jgi:hypothetical protein